MPSNVSFFAIHCDDLSRARHFYGQVFGWRFEPWGPPGYYLIHTGDEKNPGIMGAMQGRQEPLTGTGMRGFDCSIAVDDIDKTIRAIEAHGGTIVMSKAEIPTVGFCIYFHDTEGNHVGAVQYEPGALAVTGGRA